MITRLEVNGFKNLLNFSVDFGPFNCIAGPNGVGKSNVFDAIQFLSFLADEEIEVAAAMVRPTTATPKDLRTLFWYGADEQMADKIRLAVEIIIPKNVQDDLGQEGKPTSTFLRYEVEIGYEIPNAQNPIGRLTLLYESLASINKAETARKLKFVNDSFQKENIVYPKRSSPYLSTKLLQDGVSEVTLRESKEARIVRAQESKRTLLSTVNSAMSPTILAVRKEMLAWIMVAPNPANLRYSDQIIETIYALANNNYRDNEPIRTSGLDGLYARIVSRLRELIPISEITINFDSVRRQSTLMVRERDGTWFPLGSLSDGTLRLLELALLAEDDMSNLFYIEEPENGIHPGKMNHIVNLLKSIAFNSNYPIDRYDNPLRQIIVATHSPVFVQLMEPETVLVATSALLRYNDQPSRALRLHPLAGTWRDTDRKGVSVLRLLDYLNAPKDAQLTAPTFLGV